MLHRLAPAFIESHDLARNYSDAANSRLYQMQDEAWQQQLARRFAYTLRKLDGSYYGKLEADESDLNVVRLRQSLLRSGLEKSLKREATHLLTIWECFPSRESQCLAQLWVGSHPGIKLTDWSKELRLPTYRSC